MTPTTGVRSGGSAALRIAVMLLIVVVAAAAQDRRLERTAGERRVALVIGNDRYPSAPLSNAVNDARAMAEALRDVGFSVTLNENATSEAIDRAIVEFGGRIEPGDVALFYYSGHGAQVDGENYLVPIDYTGRDEIALKRRTVALSDVYDRLQRRGARVSLIILDACRDNPYRAARSGAQGLAKFDARGALVAFATAPGSTASDNSGGRNGLFTQHLIEALRVPGLTASELFRQVRQKVSEVSGGGQYPWLSDGLIGDFVFRASAPRTTGAAAPTAPPAASATDTLLRVDLEFWNSIKDSRDPNLFENYLRQFPQGQFKVLAESRLAELRRPPAPAPAPAPIPPPAPAPTTVTTPTVRRPTPIVGRASDWPAYSADVAGSRYSALDQINPDTIKDLRIAWRQSAMPRSGTAARSANYEHTPLMVGGLLYMSTADGGVAALHPATGQVIWTHTPSGQGAATRGLGYWSDGRDERVLGIEGRFLLAFNAKTGELLTGFGSQGRVDLGNGSYTPDAASFASSAPTIVGNAIIVGGIPRPPAGAIAAFDVRSGKVLWTFNAVPRPGEFGADTWENNSWRSGAFGWSMVSADPQLGLVYVRFESPTGAGSARPGINLFADTIVCLDAKTGQRKWHFQLVHHGVWGYDASATPILADVNVGGRSLKTVALPSAQGFVYVFDRVTGMPIWPIVETPVPQSDLPGERTSPTQPIPTRPPPFERQGVRVPDDLADFSPELRAEAERIVSRYKAGPLFTPPSSGGTILVPGVYGGSWSGAAFDRESGLLFVPSSRLPSTASIGPSGVQLTPALEGPGGLPDPFKPPYSTLTAIDLNRGDLAWQVPNGVGPQQTVSSLAHINAPAMGTPGRAAPLVTKNFVFLGEGSNTAPGVPASGGGRMFRAYDKATGKEMWKIELPGGTSGAPMTYAVNGKQYIVVAVSWRDAPSELIALALP